MSKANKTTRKDRRSQKLVTEISQLLTVGKVATHDKDGKPLTLIQRLTNVIVRVTELERSNMMINQVGAKVDDGHYDYTKDQNTFLKLFGGYMAQLLRQNNAENYVELRLQAADMGVLLLTVQKLTGKSAHELKLDAEKNVAELVQASFNFMAVEHALRISQKWEPDGGLGAEFETARTELWDLAKKFEIEEPVPVEAPTPEPEASHAPNQE